MRGKTCFKSHAAHVNCSSANWVQSLGFSAFRVLGLRALGYISGFLEYPMFTHRWDFQNTLGCIKETSSYGFRGEWFWG